MIPVEQTPFYRPTITRSVRAVATASRRASASIFEIPISQADATAPAMAKT